MENKVIYFGREIRTILPTDMPPFFAMIDVMQKEGDCPKGYPIEERETCIIDCQNAYASFVYNVLEKRIQAMGALSRNVTNYIADNLRKHNLTLENLKGVLEGDDSDVKIEKFPERVNAYYKGDLLFYIPTCEFVSSDKITTNEPEIQQYINLVTENPEKIMKECGVEIVKKGCLEVILYNRDKNRSTVLHRAMPDSI